MFTDEVVGVVDFQSAWRKERDSESISTQTKGIKTDESSAQAIIREDAEVQTEPDDKDYSLVEETNPEKLLAFLKSVEPMISKALNRNIQSTAFDGYEISHEADSGQCTNVHTLNYAEFTGHLAVTSLSWNATGSVVAASYGRFDHEDWCTHKAGMCTWNLNKSGMSGDKPDSVIDTSSCLMSVDFHPVQPALVAGGTFNGDVMVWDLSKESDMLIASSSKGDDSHNEPISNISWYQVPGKRRLYHVLSVGMDGKMLVWKLDKDKGRLKLSNGFMLLAKHMPRSVKVKSSKKNQEMGITSLAFSAVDEDTFYIGAESGGLFKCSVNSRSEIGDGTRSKTLIDPVALTFLPHKGPVYSVSSSPHHRNLFLSCSSDTTLRLHNVLQTQPLIILEPSSGYLYTVRWSPVRPLVMIVATQEGNVLVYDLKKSQTTPVQILDASPNKQSVHTAEFNHKQKNLLASGDALGVVKVWKLNDELTTESASERDLLNSMVHTSSQE